MSSQLVASEKEMTDNIKLEPSWKRVLVNEFEQPYMQKLKEFLAAQKKQRKVIFPKGENIFKAFDHTPYDKVKVAILGQDPYHGPGQAHGLCFSVLPGVRIPPSLQNIYKELAADVGFEPVKHGNLSYWARQGVLLMNSVLTVEQGQAGSHQGKGWEHFTDRVIECLNDRKKPVIFVLWGAYAQKKGQKIDRNKHLVLESVHPSPLSASRGFFGNHHFSRINQKLLEWGEQPIDWQLPAEVTEEALI